MEARLFTIPGSHPGIAAALMLDHKGIAYKRTDLMPVISKVVLRGLGYPRQTVPALKIDGEKFQGSRPIARELERLRPEPALFPADPAKRAERATIGPPVATARPSGTPSLAPSE